MWNNLKEGLKGVQQTNPIAKFVTQEKALDKINTMEETRSDDIKYVLDAFKEGLEKCHTEEDENFFLIACMTHLLVGIDPYSDRIKALELLNVCIRNSKNVT